MKKAQPLKYLINISLSERKRKASLGQLACLKEEEINISFWHLHFLYEMAEMRAGAHRWPVPSKSES